MRKHMAPGTGIAIASAAALVLAVAGPVATATAADSGGTLTLCSNGYTSYASFPGRGGRSTDLVNSGSCESFYFGGDQNEQVDIYEFGGNNGVTGWSTYIGSTIYNGIQGLTIVTVPGPSFFVA